MEGKLNQGLLEYLLHILFIYTLIFIWIIIDYDYDYDWPY